MRRTAEGKGAVVRELEVLRDLLGPADPAAGRVDEDAAHDEEGRAALARILADPKGKQGKRRWYRRRWTVVAAAVLVIGGAAVAADASGVLPTKVIEGFTKADDGSGAPILLVDLGTAEKIAERRAPNGNLVQWWQARNKAEGYCWVLRVKSADGNNDGSGVECMGETILSGAGELWLAGGERVGYAADDDTFEFRGQAPSSAVEVKATFKDGQESVAPVNKRGYFLGFYQRPPDIQSYWPVKVEAFDAQGRSVAVHREE